MELFRSFSPQQDSTELHGSDVLRRFAAAAWLGAPLLAGLVLLGGCTLPPDPTAGAGTSTAEVLESGSADGSGVPANWPEGVPVFDGGTLTSADSDAAGTYFSLTWDVTGSPAEAVEAYSADLQAAGFTAAGEPYSDDTSALSSFTGDGFDVSLYAAVGADGITTELNITVQPTTTDAGSTS